MPVGQLCFFRKTIVRSFWPQAGQIAAVFNGLRQRDLPGVKSGSKTWSDYRIRLPDTSDHLSHPNLLALINVLHSCNKEIDLDIGKKEESLSNYRATLAHKCCHSFKPNSHFAQFWHPMWVISTSLNLLNSSTSPGTAWWCLSWRPETWWPARRSLSPTTTLSRRRPSGIRCCSRASRWFL